jgi:ABC-2 type transport system ATP-binding protein
MDIKIAGLQKSFDHKPVIRDLSMQVNSGDILCLLGPSGSGKTTLIRLILGAIAPDHGEIFINGRKVPDLGLLASIGFMPQNDALYEDLSAEDNLRFYAGLFGIKSRDFRARQIEVLEIVGLANDRHKLVRNYSGGMKKRLSLAATLIHEPDLLLLDEPTVGIDPVLRRSIWQEFKQLKAQGKTLVVTTHVMDEVAECDRAGLIDNGQLIAYDTVPNLMARTAHNRLEELFFLARDAEKGVPV